MDTELEPLKVLIIDDEESVGTLVQRRLQRRGLTASFHRGFFGATMAAIAERPDVVLLDVNMDGLMGSSLIPALRKRPELSHCRFVLFSSMDTRELARLAVDSGADAWLSKSAELSTLVSELQRLVAAGRSAQLGG